MDHIVQRDWRILIPYTPYEDKLMSITHSLHCSEGVADVDSLSKQVEAGNPFNILFKVVADFEPL